MGWSATAKACRTFDRWSAACVEQTGNSNLYESGGSRYFFERGREQADGAITGTVFRFVDGRDDLVNRCGSFRIDADGSVRRYPASFGRAFGKLVAA